MKDELTLLWSVLHPSDPSNPWLSSHASTRLLQLPFQVAYLLIHIAEVGWPFFAAELGQGVLCGIEILLVQLGLCQTD